MRLYRAVYCSLAFLFLPCVLLAQGQPPSDPQALAFAAQSIAALTGGTAITDVTLTGTGTWNGVGTDSGGATLRALGTSESRMDLALTSGTRSEIRDAQTGSPLGQWFNPDGSSGYFAFQNLRTDAVWFFPSLGSLEAGANVVLTYVGQETRNGVSVQHIESYFYQSNPPPLGLTPQQLSGMDFYLDAASLLPVATLFTAYPDNGTTPSLSIEVDFSDYQNQSGAQVPMHIQKYSQGAMLLDVTISGVAFNSGLPLSLFAIN